MAIIAPTIDRFDESTVMRMLRKLIGWVKDDLIPQINDNDIASVDKTVDGMTFSIDLVKGDGSKISVGQITMDDSDKNVASGEFTFDTNNRKLSGVLTTGDGTEIAIPAVTIPAGSAGDVDDFVSGAFNYSDNQLTLTLNRESGTNPLVVPPVTIVSGGGGTGGNPYPTAISGTVTSTGQIQLSITMSEGSPLTGNIDMSYFASVEDLEEIQTQLTNLTIATTVSQDSTNVIKVSNAVNGNSADLKLDLAIVGTDIILTAENGDGTQQATTKIAVGDIPFEKGKEIINISSTFNSSTIRCVGTYTTNITSLQTTTNQTVITNTYRTINSKLAYIDKYGYNIINNESNNNIQTTEIYTNQKHNLYLITGGEINITGIYGQQPNVFELDDGKYKAKIQSIGIRPLTSSNAGNLYKDILTNQEEDTVKNTLNNFLDIEFIVSNKNITEINLTQVNFTNWWSENIDSYYSSGITYIDIYVIITTITKISD